MTSLDLGVIGNCSISALVDNRGRIVWGCFPRFDGDPVFCELVNSNGNAEGNRPPGGVFAIEIEDFAHSKVSYLQNTAVLSTILYDNQGSALEIIDYVPRFTDQERIYRPQLLVRVVTPVSGRPRMTVRLQPRFDYGATVPSTTRGTHHVRFVGADQVLRLTTTAPISYILEEKAFAVDRPLVFIFGNDERIPADIERTAREFLDRTISHWRSWVRSLSIPYDWQDEVIRAAITLKLCNYEETGAIVAALTTSIPEAPGTGRNWDYRYCWLRDAYFVIHALNQLGATRTMEDYIGYINDLVDDSAADRLRPVYSITRDSILDEWTAEALNGYRGNRPVRVGNAAYLQIQNDVYGSVVLASTHAFFDKRLIRGGDEQLFQRLESLGKHAVATFDQPDAGPWELRDSVRIHTFSSLMSWTACDRLAKIAEHIALPERAIHWRTQAGRIHEVISKRAWNEELQSFVSVFDSQEIDASLLLMAELGFLSNDDPRFASTVAQVQRRLCWGQFLFRYIDDDGFGKPTTAFLICSFWLVNALFAIGKKEEARRYFQDLLKFRNPLGLLSEDIDPKDNELWGNFPQTYSMVGLINCAVKLSRRWDQVL